MRFFNSTKFYWLACTMLVCVVVGTHVVSLSTVPRGLTYDEIGMAYDAWSISKTGHDSYMHSWPVYFLNRGDGMSALYVYAEAAVMAVFGVSVAGMRAPAVLASFVTLFAGAYIVRSQWPRRRLPLLLYLFLFAVLPYFTVYSRIALDCNLFLPLSTLLLATIVFNLRRNVSLWWLSGIVAGITLYSYVLSWIIVPLFLAAFTGYLLWCRRLTWRQAAALWLPLCLIALPLMGVVAVNFGGLAQFSIGPFTVPKLVRPRASEFGFRIQNAGYFFRDLFLRDRLWRYDDPRITPLQLISIPFALLGFGVVFSRGLRAVQRRRMNMFLITDAWMIAYLMLAIFVRGENNHGVLIHNLNGMFFAVLFSLVAAFVWLFDKLSMRTALFPGYRRNIPQIFLIAGAVLYLVLFAWFLQDYFIAQPRLWDNGNYAANDSILQVGPTADYPFLRDAIKFVDSRPQEVSSRATHIYYVNMAEDYYFLAKQVLPAEIVAGKRKYGVIDSYKNYTFTYQDTYSLDENYIIADWKGPELAQLRSMGFSSVRRFGKYWVFTNP